LTRWIGPGRKLTRTGQLTMADARYLVGHLETGDEIDPITTIYDDGWVWSRAPTSIPHVSTPLRPTGASSQ